MARRERKTWIIFPEYFDKQLSRSESRRVPKELAVNSPDIEEIGKILNSWDIPNRIEKHQHHPSTWYEGNGRIIIPKQKGSKQKLLKKISEELKSRRKD
ncbi:MAG: signal recognition particle protein Srp19 [Candidatus Thermoplasmatota archaeon]|nr:signal recognition particle protein Srp19 [Candidatus Thermoplasmatota archaeon]MBS3789447.1 signal recognition particle protein Srp19 [Candidatus Thermoplasmatota archaeon]